MGWSVEDTAMSLVYLDTNGDGLVDFTEFLAWYERAHL